MTKDTTTDQQWIEDQIRQKLAQHQLFQKPKKRSVFKQAPVYHWQSFWPSDEMLKHLSSIDDMLCYDGIPVEDHPDVSWPDLYTEWQFQTWKQAIKGFIKQFQSLDKGGLDLDGESRRSVYFAYGGDDWSMDKFHYCEGDKDHRDWHPNQPHMRMHFDQSPECHKIPLTDQELEEKNESFRTGRNKDGSQAIWISQTKNDDWAFRYVEGDAKNQLTCRFNLQDWVTNDADRLRQGLQHWVDNNTKAKQAGIKAVVEIENVDYYTNY